MNHDHELKNGMLYAAQHDELLYNTSSYINIHGPHTKLKRLPVLYIMILFQSLDREPKQKYLLVL